MPWGLISKTVQFVRNADCWQISYRGELVAQHPVLPRRHRLSVLPEHGPGATGRNVRRRFAEVLPATTIGPVEQEVEIRDLDVYEQMLEVA